LRGREYGYYRFRLYHSFKFSEQFGHEMIPFFNQPSYFENEISTAVHNHRSNKLNWIFASRHRNSASILTVELQAIFQCLEKKSSLPLFRSLTHPHCLRLLIRPVSHFKCSFYPPLSHTYSHLLTTLSSILLSTTFIWVPSYKGIQGNESVDSAAKTATSSSESSLVFYPQNLISPSLYANIPQTTGFPFGRNRHLPINMLKLNPYLSPGLCLTKHIAVIKSTSHASTSVTLVSHMLTFSPTYFPLSCEHCSLDSPLTVNHMFECPALTVLRLFHHVPHSLKASISPTTPHLSSTYSLTSMQPTIFHASNTHSSPPSS